MNKQQRPILLIVILALIVGLVGPAALPGIAKTVHAHPLLQQLAAANPDALIAVIVQKAEASDRAEQLAKSLGGAITRDLRIINAFAAEMTAEAALELAASPAVRWVSLDASLEQAGKPAPAPAPVTNNTYLETLGVRNLWNMGVNGTGIGVAVIDSGITNSLDVPLKRSATFNPNSMSTQDYYGHGTHIGGIVAGTGALSAGKFMGVAPGVNLISLKVCDETGMAYESDVVAAMQWILGNRTQYNIRVVNLSLNSTVQQSYHTSPLDAAAEILWFNGFVVVASAGNSSANTPIDLIKAAPANDPFIIVVGATDEKGTSAYTDDTAADFGAYGVTGEGFIKPDIFAPGANIISVLSGQSSWDETAPDRVVDGTYFRLSGTSMAAPMVTGTVALLLQDEPNLTPDQVKYRLLKATSRSLARKVGKNTYSIPYLDSYAAITGTTTQSANTGLTASQLLWTGSEPITWGSVAWNSVAWNSVAWNSVAWNSVAWNSVAWNSVFWGP